MQKLHSIAKKTEMILIHFENLIDNEFLYLLYLTIVANVGIAIHKIKIAAGYALNKSPVAPVIIINPTINNNSPQILFIVKSHCINI